MSRRLCHMRVVQLVCTSSSASTCSAHNADKWLSHLIKVSQWVGLMRSRRALRCISLLVRAYLLRTRLRVPGAV